MKGSFEDNNNQVRRLMEQIGGSVSAYEEPRPAPQPAPTPIVEKPNPFRDPEEPLVEKPAPTPEPEEPSLAEQTGLTVEVDPDPDEEAWAQILAEEPAWTEEIQEPSDPDEFVCGTGLEEIFRIEHGFRPQTQPDSLGDSYQLHGPVWSCGELAAVWNGFVWVAANGEPKEVTLDSGTAEVHRDAGNHWVLEDPAKDRQYLKEDGNLAGSLAVADIFIWVKRLNGEGQDFGYLHNGWVFLRKEQP
jgi:hypothetical protein